MKVTVKISGIQSTAGKISAQGNRMSNYCSRLENLAAKCTLSDEAGRSIIQALRNSKDNIATQGRQLKLMGSALREVGDTYKNTEKTVSSLWSNVARKELPLSFATVVENIPDMAKTKTTSMPAWTWKDTWKVIGKAGIVGSGADLINKLITGDGSAKAGIDFGKSFSTLLGNVASAVGAGSKWSEYIFGTNSALKNLNISSLGKAFKCSWESFREDLNFVKAQNNVEKCKAATKWAGHILTLASNGLENIEEAKDGSISTERAVAETVMETGVDIAVGVGATAVTSAGMAALGFVGAPAVAVGAGAAVVTWAANGVCKWVTGGKDLGEVVADVGCDIAEGIGKKAQEVVGGISNCWKNLSWGF